jgi:hypothetical protein
VPDPADAARHRAAGSTRGATSGELRRGGLRDRVSSTVHPPVLPSVALRLIGSLTAALFGMVLATGSVAANEPGGWILPEDDAETRIPALVPAPLAEQPRPVSPASESEPADAGDGASPTATPTPAPTPAPEPIGHDISYPQCREPYPDPLAFAIVGVNRGRVFSTNPCFAPGEEPSQLEWAGRDAELYFNTGNPGPRASRFWPSGQTEPRPCDTRRAPGEDTIDCAYVYGWNSAAAAYTSALAAFVELDWADADAERLPGDVTIWLDVEPANSWRNDRALNRAALEGAVAYLESAGVERIGFYSTPRLWNRITGGSDLFDEYPAWHAGARDRADAERRCREERAFTGGELAMVQWVEDGFDLNIRCAAVEPAP